MANIKTQAFVPLVGRNRSPDAGLMRDGSYTVLLARDGECVAGFVALAECRALYAEGRFGVIPELYVRPDRVTRRGRRVGGRGQACGPLERLGQA
ncbi:MAG: hypothetical protein KF848_09265 [Nitrospira sp.]|nr:hypothetical protein [Nitrospira sp.]